MFERVEPILKEGERFIITAHEHADGDALGSQIALYYFLKQLGKDVRAINCDESQRKIRFIDPDGVVERYRAGGGPAVFGSPDAWIVVDTSAIARIGTMGELVPRLRCTKIAIDHHVFYPEEAFADISAVDDKAVATAVLVFQLGHMLGCRLDELIATALYVGIYTDSGGFVYSKMNPTAHRIAAELMEAGVRPWDIYDRLYQAHTAAEAELFGRVLNTLRFERNGAVAWLTITRRMYDDSGADPEGSENHLLDYVRAIRDVELVVLLRQIPGGRVKVSLRSNRLLHVSPIARALGGGGHWFAAGAYVPGSINRVRERLRKLIEEKWPKDGREAEAES